MALPVFLIAGAVYVLLRLSGTFTKFVWRRTGLVDLLLDPPPEVRARNPAIFDVARFFINLNEARAYDLTTRAGIVEMTADLAALGLKITALRGGVGLISRLAAALGLRGSILNVGDLPDSLKRVIDILGADPASVMADLVSAWARANLLLEKGKGREDELSEIIGLGTAQVLDTVKFADKAAGFLANPNVVGGAQLLLQGFDLAIGFLDFVTAAIPFIPDLPTGGTQPGTRFTEAERASEAELFERRREEEKIRRRSEEEKRAEDLSRLIEEARAERASIAKRMREQLGAELLRSEFAVLEFLKMNPRQPGESVDDVISRVIEASLPPFVEPTLPELRADLTRKAPSFQRFRGSGPTDLRRIVAQLKKGG